MSLLKILKVKKMKKISNSEMSKIEGGLKCIYHYMAIALGPLVGIFNTTAVIECWNNNHKE